jgi:hypothetical protein
MVWRPQSGAVPRSRAQTVQNCGGRTVAFIFEEHVEGIADPVPSVSALQQENFKTAFCREIANIEKWAAQNQWPLRIDLPDLEIHVSGQYRLARSLVPIWMGEPGFMEFPALRVAVGEANILHELVHVYFPNSNRMLAEGLAVHLHQEIGESLGYPNFGEDLHFMMRCKLETELRAELKEIRLCSLDKITTPTNLTLRVERRMVHDRWTYIIAGSFVRFLLETYDMHKFRAVYAKTPLVPLQRDAGAPQRWNEVYGLSLEELELRWKSVISALNCP